MICRTPLIVDWSQAGRSYLLRNLIRHAYVLSLHLTKEKNED